ASKYAFLCSKHRTSSSHAQKFIPNTCTRTASPAQSSHSATTGPNASTHRALPVSLLSCASTHPPQTPASSLPLAMPAAVFHAHSCPPPLPMPVPHPLRRQLEPRVAPHALPLPQARRRRGAVLVQTPPVRVRLVQRRRADLVWEGAERPAASEMPVAWVVGGGGWVGEEGDPGAEVGSVLATSGGALLFVVVIVVVVVDVAASGVGRRDEGLVGARRSPSQLCVVGRVGGSAARVVCVEAGG
ncbi:hypothetical protein B0J12DRAFT_749940, partial [Macrophomina phaseolina]